MTIPPKIQVLVDRLSQELGNIELQAIDGLNLVRPLLAKFNDNIVLTQFFASFSNAYLFVEISKRRVQVTVNRFSYTNLPAETLLEIGEDLSTELGKVLEVKIQVERLLNRLQELS